MMRKNYITNLLFILVSFGFWGCQKDTPTDNQGDVLFKFDGTIGNKVVFEAGVNNYIMSTDFTDNGVNDILLMRGEFVDKSDSSNDFLRFEFYGYDSVNNGGILQNVFNQTNYNSYSADSSQVSIGNYDLQFYSVGGIGANYTWDFGDNSTGIGDTVQHSYNANTVGIVPVTLNTFYPLPGCGDSIINNLNFNDLVNSKVGFTFTTNQTNDNFVFSAFGNATSFQWDLGNGFTPTGATSQAFYTDSLQKLIQLTANIASSTYSWRAKITPFTPSCLSYFDYDILSTPTTVSGLRLPYKTCIITYKQNGVTYSSFKNDNSNQSGRTVFNLNSAAAYQTNPNGQPTIQLQGSVQTYLYNVNNVNDSILMNSSNVSIAVAYP